MPESITVARPYVKAAFDFVVKRQSIERWQDMLTFVAGITRNEQMAELPSSTLAPEVLVESFITVCGKRLDENGQNLIRVMAKNGRLNAFPDVLGQFIHPRVVDEVIAEVDVISVATLSEQQFAKISATMGKHLSRKARLNCKIDRSVVTGVIIRADDMVTNSSVRDHLERLADVLQP